MHTKKIFGLLLLSASLFTSTAHAQGNTFKVGIAPHTSARVILEMYQPLRHHLERTLGQPVDIQTAPDFTEFGRRALNQEYDIAVTTGHQARLYQTDAGYLPLLTYKADFKAVALVAKDNKYRKPSDLNGATVLALSPTSLVSLWGVRWLKSNNIKELTVRYVSAADSVSRQVLAGDAALAFTSLANFQKLPAEQQEALRIVAESEAMAGRVYLLNKRQSGQQAKVEAALWSFADSEEGRKYFEQNKLEGYRKLRPKELEAMEPYAAETRQILKGK
ncbi:phosphate/phosphite/phosphonate ABC transporter substrate-binding protein [Quatrionicoccus australiensis]|uniref:phosphate/phosphite/phosphonate ABC transporter substrate-binding protein n=1 Tax=Quatrionicoccus australiensis TaxID=138118 RepID=UPI001CFB3BBA|nr:phosphate/phosphite/phosphonate ABC transporter substrate-binding protein [Quatrionicoccus australiensis]MCB4359933.1 phosphate/phosphite/phosphonate ABC transporter substrate-binding protein [Quatrionicoccus australiensis]